jgi:hypothetical protein
MVLIHGFVEVCPLPVGGIGEGGNSSKSTQYDSSFPPPFGRGRGSSWWESTLKIFVFSPSLWEGLGEGRSWWESTLKMIRLFPLPLGGVRGGAQLARPGPTEYLLARSARASRRNSSFLFALPAALALPLPEGGEKSS